MWSSEPFFFFPNLWSYWIVIMVIDEHNVFKIEIWISFCKDILNEAVRKNILGLLEEDSAGVGRVWCNMMEASGSQLTRKTTLSLNISNQRVQNQATGSLSYLNSTVFNTSGSRSALKGRSNVQSQIELVHHVSGVSIYHFPLAHTGFQTLYMFSLSIFLTMPGIFKWNRDGHTQPHCHYTNVGIAYIHISSFPTLPLRPNFDLPRGKSTQ